MIDFEQLARNMKGDVMTDSLHQMIYATDASAYREMPLAVVYPRDASDVKECIKFARKNGITLIPRAAGTSLAGQVVGNGVVVDVSRYMNHVLEINEKEHWVRVEPGVVLDELNMRVKSLGLFFGPETSTLIVVVWEEWWEIIRAVLILWCTGVLGIIFWRQKLF